MAGVSRSVSFGWRLGEICSLRGVESFRYRGALLWVGCPLFLPRGFPARRGDEISAHVPPHDPLTYLGGDECLLNSDSH